MAKEVVELLKPAPGKVFIDATLGEGGHTEKLKEKNEKLKIIGFDLDPNAMAVAKQRLSSFKKIVYLHDSYTNLKKHVKNKIDGILFDLGISSFQLNQSTRGFSFQANGPLDMRFDQKQKLTASKIVNHYPQKELEKIIRAYGEEKFARRISQTIAAARRKKEIKTTFELREIIEKATPGWKKRKILARVFQALRIAVNHELDNLKRGLLEAADLLSPHGRMVVISYHSLEDRIVKQTFRSLAQQGIIKIITKKPLRPGSEEIRINPRARSAKLRAAEKI
jgi:16S rRNA (cytosine1402-N4)-methyltransferase